MLTQHPVLKRGGLFWDQTLLPRAIFDDRYGRIQAAIRENGDDAWLVYGDAQRYGDIAYATHFVTRLRSALALIPKDGAPSLLANVGLRDIPASKTLTWVDDLRPFSRLPQEAVKLVKERGFTGARIGLVGTRASLPIAEWDAIAAELPGVTWTERDAAMWNLRVRKEPAELDAIAKAASVVRGGLTLAAELLRPGRSAREIAALIDREMRVGSAEDARILIASGPQCAVALRPPDDRILEAGDPVMLLLGAETQRYWAEGGQTYVLGAAPAKLRALAQTAVGAVDAMRQKARAGASASAVAETGEDSIEAPFRAKARSYGLGHGIGLDVDESPAIATGLAEKLDAPSALALHVVLHADGLGAVAGTTAIVGTEETTALLDIVPLIECKSKG